MTQVGLDRGGGGGGVGGPTSGWGRGAWRRLLIGSAAVVRERRPANERRLHIRRWPRPRAPGAGVSGGRRRLKRATRRHRSRS